MAAHQDALVDPKVEDPVHPILLAVSDNGPQMTSGSTRQVMALNAIGQHFGRPGTPTVTLILRPLSLEVEDDALLAHQKLAADGFEFLLDLQSGEPWAAYIMRINRYGRGESLPDGYGSMTYLVAVVDGRRLAPTFVPGLAVILDAPAPSAVRDKRPSAASRAASSETSAGRWFAGPAHRRTEPLRSPFGSRSTGRASYAG